MKKAFLCGLMVLPVLVWGQTFDSTVDFNLELSTLSDPVVLRNAVEDGRIAILEGLMGDTVVDLDGEEPKIWVTLMGGSWLGTEEVRAYSCRILFIGEEWLEAFPGSRPREPGPSYVPQGSRLLIAARITGRDDDTGTPLAEMLDFRVLN